MIRRIFRVIKRPTSNESCLKKDRMALVDFCDYKGMKYMDVPELPNGTVIEVKGSSYDILFYKDEECTETLKKWVSFYEETKNFLPYSDYKKCESYKGMAIDIYKINPYFFFSSSFFSKDDISEFKVTPIDVAKYNMPKTFEERRQEIASFIEYELVKEEKEGNTYTPVDTIFDRVKRNLKKANHPLNEKELAHFLSFIEFYNCLSVKNESDAKFFLDTANLSRKSPLMRYCTYKTERSIYEDIAERMSTGNTIPIDKSYVDEISEEQNEAIVNLFKDGTNISAMTGGPGTGKTTILKQVISKISDLPNGYMYKIAILAPTGKSMSKIKVSIYEQLTDSITVATMHMFCEYGKALSDEVKEKISDTNLIIIDEASMIPIEVYERIISCTDAKKTKVILVGDADQLPSVDAGNLFYDAIKAGVPTFYLNQNYRSIGAIVELSKMIKNESLSVQDLIWSPLSSIDNSEDVVTLIDIEGLNTADIENRILDYTIQEIEAGNQITVLYAKRRGELSSINMNNKIGEKLRQLRNEEGVATFAIGDSVIATRTKYGLTKNETYFNGNTGIVTGCFINGARIDYSVVFDGNNYEVYVNEDHLELAYALTCHKSQGSEYDTVVILMPEKDPFVTWNLLYTEVTRAKKRIVILTKKEVLEYAVNNGREKVRRTYLSLQKLS